MKERRKEIARDEMKREIERESDCERVCELLLRGLVVDDDVVNEGECVIDVL
jgi:hypothetical protein